MPFTVPSEAPVDPKINYVRDEVTAAMPRISIVRDCLGGQLAMERAALKYVPMPNATDTSKENKERYAAYLKRAVFYNATSRTVQGWVGQVFSRDPISYYSTTSMDELWEDIDGDGVALDQQSKRALSHSMAFGHAGLLVDYPDVELGLTIAQIRAGYIRPTIALYEPDGIINWDFIRVGAKRLLSLVVLREQREVRADGFSIEVREHFRVLRLTPALECTSQVWQFNKATGRWDAEPIKFIRGPDGRPLNRIPFFPIGIGQNNMSIDLSPTYDLAVLNVAHFRNSADYEESCFMVGQPTPVFAGLTQEWVEDVFKGTVELGSRAAVPLPVGGTAQLLQVNPNTMTLEAMKHKEAQMVAIGARIIKDDSVQKTLGESQMDEAGEQSILATAAKNVSRAYSMALKAAAYLMGFSMADIAKVNYSLNTDFPASRLTPNDRAQLVAEWQSQAISFSEMRAAMRKGGIATQDDEVARAEIKKFPPPKDEPTTQQGKSGEHLNKGDGGGNQAGS